MSKKLLLGLTLGLAVCFQSKAAYVPVVIATGYNHDVIVDGVGTTLSRTTSDVDGVNYCFIANGWQYNATTTGFAGGLPANRIITSPITTGLTYQLAPYDGNNCLRLATNSVPETLTFQTAVAAQNVYVLVTGGSGSGTMTAVVNFTDNTTQTFSGLNVMDWYGNTPFEIGQIGRILRNTTSTNANIESATNGPRMYRVVLAISAANQAKQIGSVQFTRNTVTGVDTKLNIFGISVETSNIVTCAAPTAATATSITTTTASLNWAQTGTPPQWQIKYGPTGFNVNTGGTSIFTPTRPYTLNPPLTSATTYDYYVRAVCGANDTSAWTAVTTFTTACVGETITSYKDSFVCVSGSATLLASASGVGSVKWYAAATGGTALFTGNTFNTPNITASATYYVAASSGTCESSPRQAVQAVVRPRPTVNLGNDTTICPGASLTFNATVTGATYLWNYNSATTSTITTNQAGMYTVGVTLNKCTNRDTILVTPGIVPTSTLPTVLNICDGFTDVLNAGNAGSTYVWSPGGETTQTKTISSGGVQSVSIRSVNGCVVNSQTAVFMRPNPVPTLLADTSICESATITLDAGNPGHTYVWSTNDSTQTIQVSDSGSYSVLTTSQYGCELEEEVHIAFLPSPRAEGFNFIPYFNNELGRVKFIPLNPTDVTSVHWDFGDGKTSTAFSPENLYDVAGVYEVTLSVYNDCNQYQVKQNINVQRPETLGVGSADLTNNFTVYPNPASNQINILNQHNEATIQKVVLINTLGAKILEVDVNAKPQETVKVSLDNLTNGIYFLQVTTNSGWFNKKIEILQR